MAEEIINKTVTTAPDYLKPGIEQYLKMLTQQTGQPMDTSKFAPGVAGIGALQQQAQQMAATQAGLGTLQFDPKTGTATGVSGYGFVYNFFSHYAILVVVEKEFNKLNTKISQTWIELC